MYRPDNRAHGMAVLGGYRDRGSQWEGSEADEGGGGGGVRERRLGENGG